MDPLWSQCGPGEVGSFGRCRREYWLSFYLQYIHICKVLLILSSATMAEPSAGMRVEVFGPRTVMEFFKIFGILFLFQLSLLSSWKSCLCNAVIIKDDTHGKSTQLLLLQYEDEW